MLKRLKIWLIKTFLGNRILLGNIIIELQNIHYHLDRLETFYMTVNKIEIREEETVKDEKDN